jgi:hypothetical protein
MHLPPLARAFFLLSAAAGASHATLITYADLAAFNSVATAAVVEDFESAFPKNVSLENLTHNGITYTPNAGVPFFNVFIAGPGYNNFGTPTTTSSVLTANGDEDFELAFAATTAFGFDTYLNKYGPATIRAYGASGLLGTYTLNQDPTKIGFWGVTSDDEAITSIRWNTIKGGQVNTGIDNIRMGSLNQPLPPLPTVPEPSAMALFGLGLASIGWMGRRKPLNGKRSGAL